MPSMKRARQGKCNLAKAVDDLSALLLVAAAYFSGKIIKDGSDTNRTNVPARVRKSHANDTGQPRDKEILSLRTSVYFGVVAYVAF